MFLVPNMLAEFHQTMVYVVQSTDRSVNYRWIIFLFFKH